ncbi:hypothetical protein GCM10027435_16790 [Haloparvum alkalitolerans]|uniref:hypothetical protein n=1 Tax=Haloparvum TaxID=1820337 RepID=UPI00071E79EF|nr:hypothetical protein [Haloparvum sedimenti]
MDEVELGVPRGVIESLPEESESVEQDMRRAIVGVQSGINEAVAEADDPGEAAAAAVDAIEYMEARMERFDEFVPELRAWGQSPIYAIAWRNLYAELIAQLYDHDWLAAELDRERNYRLVEDGIRFGGQ